MTDRYYQHIISTLPKCDMEDYPPELFKSFARHGAMLRRGQAWCGELSEEMFLSWVLCPRVNNEQLSDCRELFYRELAPRVKGMSLTDAILEVNRWCAENVTYRSTDIRTASALAVYESGCGRCGEESMFAVNALRSIGIAARQVYAPWWSHCDDNHAWVEAFDGERWRFFGACEPEPRLDLGWFIPAAGRAMLCHAKCFVGDREDWQRLLPGEDPREVDLREGVAYIGVTQRYAKVRPFTVRVTDPKGSALPGAIVEYHVLNEGLLRRIARRVTDRDGLTSLSLGLGSLWVTARQGGLAAEALVNTAETPALELRLPGDHKPPESFEFLPPPGSAVKSAALTDSEKLRRQRELGRARELYKRRHPGGGSVPEKPELWPWQRFPAEKTPELWQDGFVHSAPGPDTGRLTLLRGRGKGSLGLMRWQEGWKAVPAPDAKAELPIGRYRLITSYRLPSGSQLVKLKDFTLSPGEALTLTAYFRQGAPEGLLQRLPLPDPGFPFEGPALLCWIDPGAEPTEHLLNELRDLGEFPCPIHFICRGPHTGLPRGPVLHPWDNYAAETMARRLFKEPGDLPLVALADRAGCCRFACAGYNVGLVELAARLCAMI